MSERGEGSSTPWGQGDTGDDGQQGTQGQGDGQGQPGQRQGQGQQGPNQQGSGQQGPAQQGWGQQGPAQQGPSGEPGAGYGAGYGQFGQASASGQPTPPQPGGGYGTPPGQQAQHPPGQQPQQPQQPQHPNPQHPPQPGSGYGQYGQSDDQWTWSADSASASSQKGIVPLRPLSLGEIYDGAFRAIRANLPVMLGASAVVVLIIGLVEALTSYSAWRQLNDLVSQPEVLDPDQLLAEFAQVASSLLLSTGLSALLSFVATTVLTGLLIHSVSQSVIGKNLKFAALWQTVRPQILRLLGVAILIALMVIAVPVVAFGLMLLIIATDQPGLIGLGVILAMLGMLGGILVVLTFTALTTPALVLERTTLGQAFKRGFVLAKRLFWRILGIYLLTTVLAGLLQMVVGVPFDQVGSMLGSDAMWFALVTIGSVITNWITIPVLAAVYALLYIDARMRTEGLDLELAKAAQEP